MNLKKAKHLRKTARQIAVNESTDGNIVLLAYKDINHPPKPYYHEDGTMEMFAVMPSRKTVHDSVRGIYVRLKKLFRNGYTVK